MAKERLGKPMHIGTKIFLGCFGALLLVVAIWMGGFYMDKQFVNDELYTGPMKTYVAGRYIFEAPVDFKEKYITFSVTPEKSEEEALASYSTEWIDIKEIPWRTVDHEKEFRAYMQEEFDYIDRHEKNFADNIRHKITHDASSLFKGHPAACLARKGGNDTIINTYIMLDQGILHLEESRNYYVTERFEDIEVSAAQLFEHYQWGKPRRTGGNVFYTAFGMLTDYPSQREKVHVSLEKDGLKLSFATENDLYPIGGRPYSTVELYAFALMHGGTFARYREREVTYGGKTQMEFIDKLAHYDTYTANFLFTSVDPVYSLPLAPDITVEGESPWNVRGAMMPVWNSVLHSIRPVKE